MHRGHSSSWKQSSTAITFFAIFGLRTRLITFPFIRNSPTSLSHSSFGVVSAGADNQDPMQAKTSLADFP